MATRLFDGKKIAEITMTTWNGSGWTPDWSNDFFKVGGLEYDAEQDAYKVKDVDYCIEQAEDWKNSEGDFCDDELNENNEVFVNVDEIEERVEYVVFITGGDKDGEELARFDKERDAIKFAREYYAEHEDEFDPVCGGVAIIDTLGNDVIDW